jgi:NAD+ kinase
VSLKKKAGILYQPKVRTAVDLAQQLSKVIGDLGTDVWVCSSWDEADAREQLDGTELLICLGGDGTILRAARIVNLFDIPILGVNLGRIGFMTELHAADAMSKVPAFIKEEKGWIEERAMIQAEVVSTSTPTFHALNDAVVGRGERCRLIRVTAKVDGELVTTYKCDGIIVATATGCTGYALAAGGPILHPCARELILQPIAPHLSLDTALVLPHDAVVELEVNTTHHAMLSIDGQVEIPLNDGYIVKVERSPYVTRLIRSQRPASFYGTLMEKLEKRE